ncbi:hypothetical protein JNUCC1_01549 [Lentibacillus sp. JNUCC-1]|uniref:hypothetical protein n=1 Tax=Lentibacillus sp. JNUCC-1 TaxID=2654513 RepID=UPI0012E73238|nr:hypothetical protein [Lentibacillus sp. JNUCC-1]MUV37743.1 hypothetical protein [Lentibacillus sp. JNUCC-1]
MDEHIKQQIAETLTNDIYQSYPYLWNKFGESVYEHTIADNLHHLNHLELAIQLEQSNIFRDYTKWLDTVLTTRGIGTDLIIDNFKRLQITLPEKLEQTEAEACVRQLEDTIVLLTDG